MVSNSERSISRVKGAAAHTADEARDWQQQAGTLARDLLIKEGIDVGTIDLLVHCRPVEGLIRQPDGSIEKRYAKKQCLYPLQVGFGAGVGGDGGGLCCGC